MERMTTDIRGVGWEAIDERKVHNLHAVEMHGDAGGASCRVRAASHNESQESIRRFNRNRKAGRNI